MLRRLAAGAAFATIALIAFPALGYGQLPDVGRTVDGLGGAVNDTLGGLGGGGGGSSASPSAPRGGAGGGGGGGSGPVSAAGNTPTDRGGYQPPLHGANPHGQGTVGTVDIQPDPSRPLSGDPAGGDNCVAECEEVVIGRSRGEQTADGSYHGHITVLALFGNELVGVDTGPGESRAGPLDPVQRAVLDSLCTGTSICLDVLRADSRTTANGSSNRFRVAGARAAGLDVTAGRSNGNISDDGNCQNAHGDSTVANATFNAAPIANAASSSTDSRACRGGPRTQANDSQVLGLLGSPVPLPGSECGTGGEQVTLFAPLVSAVCNADDTNGVGESVAQAPVPYGVREALAVFAIEAGGTSLTKATVAASESHAVAPADGDGPPPDDGDGPPDDGDGPPDDGDGPPDDDGPGPGPGPGGGPPTGGLLDGGPGDGPTRPAAFAGAGGARDDDGRLALTGVDLIWIALLGSGALAVGLGVRRLVSA